MEQVISKFLGPLPDIRRRVSSFGKRAADETRREGSSAKERLESLSSLRIQTDDINVTSIQPHAHGGKAQVVKSTLKVGYWRKKQVAVKKLHYYKEINKRKFCNEFVHEVDLMAQLSHENIVKLIGFVEDLEEGTAWIVLSWEPNGNVSEFLATGEWEIPERISLIKDTFAGLEYLHTRKPPICHGDLKSLNILVSATYRAIITDFGSARILRETQDSQEGRDEPPAATGVRASPLSPAMEKRIESTQITILRSSNQLTLTGPAWSLRWAAPEVALGEPQSLASDIWAAGWICWEVMTNKVPFPELNSEGAIVLKVVEGHVPAAREDTQLSQVIRLCSLMTDCWAFDPRSRPNIVRCHTEVGWMPSVRPSGRKTLGASVPSPELLRQMGRIHTSQAQYSEAVPLFQQALSIATSSGDQATIATALSQLGVVYTNMSKYAEAEQHLIRAHDISARIGDEFGQANALQVIGGTYYVQSKLTKAERSYTQARTIFARYGSLQGQAITSRALGNISRKRFQYPEAEEFYNEAIDLCARIGDDKGHATTLMRLGELFSAQLKFAKAEESFNLALDKYSRVGSNLGRAHIKSALADLYRMQGHNTKAGPLYAEATALYAQVGDSVQANYCSRRLEIVSKEGDASITSLSVPGNDDVPSPTQ